MKKKVVLACMMLMLALSVAACGVPQSNAGKNMNVEPVDIETLLDRQGSFLSILVTENLKIDGRTAVYEMVLEGDSDRLSKALGEKLEHNRQWYSVAGHKNIYHLIKFHEGEYSLWKFGSFLEDEYEYAGVLESIYAIGSAQDITEVIVTPANMDNTEAGNRLQDEIGTKTITDEKKIAELYDIIINLTCYGDNNWELIDMGDSSEEGMLNRVRQGRYLTFVTAEGVKIDVLKYTGYSGTFYEYGGIAYSPLNATEKKKVDEILGIE